MHSHTHSHNSQNQKTGKLFAIGIGLNLVYIAVELSYGLMANSAALIADATHNASDVLSLILAWIALALTSKKAYGKYTFGWRKSSILIAIVNAILLFLAIGIIAVEAAEKFKNPEPIMGTQVMIVAGIGVIINGLTAMLFLNHQHDLNTKGAFLHMAADAAISLGVVVSGLLIKTTGALWIDPLMSLIIVVIIFWSTWKLFSDGITLALDAAPPHISVSHVETFLLQIPQVESIHDLHIWSMSTSEVALSVHLCMSDDYPSNLLSEIQNQLSTQFSIEHSTIQLEQAQMNCNSTKCNEKI